MANKYCNLDGYRKIKDTYTDINTGFDGVEDDLGALDDDLRALDDRVDTIITTPIDGAAAAQELVDARRGEATLGAKIDAMDNTVSEHLEENATDGVHGATSEATANTLVSRNSNGRFKMNFAQSPENPLTLTDVVKGIYTSNQTEISKIAMEYNFQYLIFVTLGISSGVNAFGVYLANNSQNTSFEITPITTVNGVSVSINSLTKKIEVQNTSGGNRTIGFRVVALGILA